VQFQEVNEQSQETFVFKKCNADEPIAGELERLRQDEGILKLLVGIRN